MANILFKICLLLIIRGILLRRFGLPNAFRAMYDGDFPSGGQFWTDSGLS